MTELREQLLTKIIRKYGFEHKKTILFANLCESYPDTTEYDRILTNICENLLAEPEEVEEEMWG